ncbi:MAG TPA: hypothetical protein VGC21_05460 [Telluria sp.]|jgi:hypothetical protein
MRRRGPLPFSERAEKCEASHFPAAGGEAAVLRADAGAGAGAAVETGFGFGFGLGFGVGFGLGFGLGLGASNAVSARETVRCCFFPARTSVRSQGLASFFTIEAWKPSGARTATTRTSELG